MMSTYGYGYYGEDGPWRRFRLVHRQSNEFVNTLVARWPTGDIMPVEGRPPEYIAWLLEQGIPVFKRRMRRVNMRSCMYYKGYQRHGLKKDLWEEFHFEEGLSDMPESRRFGFLKRQALVASSAKPEGKELGL